VRKKPKDVSLGKNWPGREIVNGKQSIENRKSSLLFPTIHGTTLEKGALYGEKTNYPQSNAVDEPIEVGAAGAGL
jgi:hypothetical protein